MLEKMNKIRKKISSRNTLSVISVVVLMILLIGSTVAWFVLNNSAIVDSFGGKVSQYDFAIFLDEECTDEIDEDDRLTFSVDEFTNVTSGKMAPGTTGAIKFWVKTTSDVVTEYRVSVDNNGMGFDFSEYAGTTPDEAYYSAVLKEHIKFYQDSTMTTPIDMTSTNQFVGTLSMNASKEVDIYWKWLYEGEDLLEEMKVMGHVADDGDAVMTEAEFLSDWNSSYSTTYTTIDEFLAQWDKDDNAISDYRDYIVGDIIIYAYGTQQEPIPAP